MRRMNIGRLIAGGLVAGVVSGALHVVISLYLVNVEMADMVQRLNLSQLAVDGSGMTWIVVDLIWGLLLVFTYAAMRPRFGAGPATATVAAVTLWLAVASVFAGLTAMGLYTQQLFLKQSALNLVTAVLAGLAGAYIYKEE